MPGFISRPKLQKAIAITSIVLALGAGSRSLAQVSADSPDTPIQQSPSPISPQDLTNLVAPIALYPDALLAQVLAASPIPWRSSRRNNGFSKTRLCQTGDLLQAAQQQPWDPSVQALVAFPSVLALLNRNVRWTTDLGNAFLAQQSDVMSAIQTLRAQARASGQLASTPQLSVNTEVQGDRSAIEIQPVNPQIIYVPSYNPTVVWGAPAEGYYPELPYAGSGFGSLFSAIANLAGFLPGFPGLLGLRSWGWALSWLANALFVNNSFFNDFGFHNSGGGYSNAGYGGSSLWVHNAHHRLGVPYGSSAVASRYGEGRGQRQLGDGWRSFGSGTRGSRLESLDSRLRNAHPLPARVSSATIAPTIAPKPRRQATSGHSAVPRERPHNPPGHFRNRRFPDPRRRPPERTPGRTPRRIIDAFSRIAVPAETLTERIQQTAVPAHSPARDLFQAQGRPRRPTTDSGTSRKPTCRLTGIRRSTASRSTHPSKSTSPRQNSKPQSSRPRRPRNPTVEATPPAATQAQNRIADEAR